MSEQKTMNPELKSKWVEALRSGEYQQTRMRLHDNNGYCCLGVLCVVGELSLNLNTAYPAIAEKVSDWKTLANMNDLGGKSFHQIADYIEANL